MFTIERRSVPQSHEVIWWALVLAFATIFVLLMH